MLRQGLSKREVLTFDTYNFKLLDSGTISYMATCCIFGLGNHHSNVISSRLSNLFSVFVLPSQSMDVIMSIHSPWLNMWLKKVCLQHSIENMACSIVTATKTLYHAVCEQFQHTQQRPHFIFSHHDLQKVFWGMYLWQPSNQNKETLQKKENLPPAFCPVLLKPASSFLNIIHLWIHECMRTFGDRLCTKDESKTLVSLIAKTATIHFGIRLFDEIQHASKDDPVIVKKTAIHTVPTDSENFCKRECQDIGILNLPQEPKPADLVKESVLTEFSLLSENSHSEEANLKSHILHPQIFQHMECIMAKLVYGPGLFLNQKQNLRCNFAYQAQDLNLLLQELREFIDIKEDDKADKYCNITTKCIIHRQRVSQLMHILRVLLIPGGHGVLIGSDKGTGRKTTVRLAAYVTGYALMEVHPGNENELYEILEKAGNQTRVDGVNVVILVHEEISQSVRGELLVAMAQRTYPELYTDGNARDLHSRLTAVINSTRYLNDCRMFEK